MNKTNTMNRIRIHLILFSLLMTGIACYSQSPNLISYQTVIRNGNNELVSNTTIGVRISILGGPEANVLVYQEEHTVKTNLNGLAYLTIGNGKILNGLITSIDWSKGPYFIKSETDPTGGKNYTIVVLSQMLSVPYAIYSSTAEKLTGTLPEKDPLFNGSIAKGITATDTSYWNKKLNTADTSRMLANYLKKSDAITTGGVETDPVFNGSIAKGITATDTSYWNKKLNTSDTSGMLANYRTGLNQKLNITDTTKMLVPYLRDADTTNMLANYRTSINNKLDAKDTTLMLSNYLKKSEAVTTGGVETDPVFNVSIAKGITATDTSYWNKKLNTADTSGILANYRTDLNKKLNITDTLNMLTPYLRDTDTTNMLRNYRISINNKLDAKDTTSMLSNYLKKSEAITTGGVEADPVFNGSIAKGITATDTSYWNRKLNTSDTLIISNRINSKLNISDFPRGVAFGNTIYWNGNNWVILAPGLPGQILSMDNDGKPIWINSIPMLTTNMISGITTNSSSSGGNITLDGGATVSARGVVWSSSSSPTVSLSTKTIDGTGKGSFSSTITGLSPNTTYYVRAYATNSVGTGYGNEITFTTNQILTIPTLTTTAISSITTSTSSSGGNITSDGGANVSARGVVWSANSSPTVSLSTKTIDGTGIGSFSSAITGLSPNTTYYVRSYATNSVGTVYGNEITFTTTSQVVTDIDGNTYNTVQIGTQLWMSENLRVTKYRDATIIPLDESGGTIGNASGQTWSTRLTGARTVNSHLSTNLLNFGYLYNWFAAASPNGICPLGWHVPTEGDWNTLVSYLGGEGVAGGKMKSTGTTYWQSPNGGATNESGFSALPGGYRDGEDRFNDNRNGQFENFGLNSFFWSASELVPQYSRGWMVQINFADSGFNTYHTTTLLNRKQYGYSVRCLKN